NQEIGSWISVPVILQEKLTGSLELASPEFSRFKEPDKQALQRVGQQASLAVSNARLYLKLLNSIKEISDARKEVERVRRNQFL
ncbi:MAG TPA: GAF domain-containing protein, partial [Acidobacteriota bacterium]|nr:GAF domain-containing protein [Acidobacteriota bacterium]